MDTREMAAGWTKGKAQILRNKQRPQGLIMGGWEGTQKVGRDPELIKVTATLHTIHDHTQSPREYKQDRRRGKVMRKF